MPFYSAPRRVNLRPRKKLALLCCAATAGLAASRARASGLTYNYVGANGSSWTVNTDWSPSSTAPPGLGDIAYFDASSASAFTVNFNAQIYTGTGLTALYIDPFGAGALTLSQTNASSVMIAASEFIGNSDSPTSTYTQSAGQNNAVSEYVGALGSGNGVYNLSGGGTNTVSGVLILSNASTSTGTYNLSGGTLSLNSSAGSNGLYIGGNGKGILNETGGTLTVSGTAVIGFNASGNGTFNQSNGASAFNGGLTVASSGTGIVNLSGGAFSASTLTLGNNAVFNQNGGTASPTELYMSLSSGATSTYNMSNGGSLVVGDQLIVGSNGKAVFNQTGGTVNSSAGGLYLANDSTSSSGTYNLSGGTLQSGILAVGVLGKGVFNQTSGSQLGSYLNLANGSASSGLYTLSGANSLLRVTAAAGQGLEIIGAGGVGTFNQSAGTNTGDLIYLGYSPGSLGTYNLSNTGSLNVSSQLAVGALGGQGVFNQTGGNVNAGTALVALGYTAVASTGTYLLSGGTLTSGTTYVGYVGTGVFNQSGGTHSVTTLSLGGATSGLGTYNLSNGANLIVLGGGGGEIIGDRGAGVFNQTGGSNKAAVLNVGNNPGANGTYTLSGTGVLTSTGIEQIGAGGTGVFNQTGGTNSVNVLSVGDNPGGVGTYNLSGSGVLISANNVEVVGNNGKGTFNQSGGFNTTTDIYLGNASDAVGTYNLSNSASLVVAGDIGVAVGISGKGTFNQTGGSASISSELDIGEFAAGSGTYTLTGGQALVSGGVYLGGSSIFGVGGTGVVNVNGGSFTAGSINGLQANSFFNINGGTVTTASIVVPSWTNVTLASGTLNLTTGVSSNSGTLTVGTTGNATLNQTGGIVSATELYMSLGSGATSTYNMSNSGSLVVGDQLIVGYNGKAVFNQTGGTVNSSIGGLYLADNATSSSGTYNLSGGTLNSGVLGVGVVGKGVFNQTGGSQFASLLNIANGTASSGIYTLSGTNSLLKVTTSDSQGLEIVGSSAAGTFNQSGGTNTGDFVYLGYSTGGFGTYNLSNTGSLNVSTQLAVGALGGQGVFNQTGGTLNASTGFLALGYTSVASTGTYLLSGGTLTSGTTYVGYLGTGVFNQSGGTHSTTTLLLANNTGSSGTYTLSGSTSLLTVKVADSSGFECVGVSGTGVFNQTGGSNRADYLELGENSGVLGTYNLSGANSSLTVTNSFQGGQELLALDGTAVFNHSGGSNLADGLTLGYDVGSLGTYNLSNSASFTVNFIASVGGSGHGVFNQTGGTFNVPDYLGVAFSAGSVGTYNLSGGNILAGDEYVGDSGNGLFNQTGGTNSAASLSVGAFSTGNGTYTQSLGQALISGGVYVGGNYNGGPVAGGTGTVNINGGTFTATGSINVLNSNSSFNINGGTVTTPSMVLPDWSNLNLNSGTLNLTGASSNTGTLIVGTTGNAVLNQTNGSIAAEGLLVANGSNSTSTYNLSGAGSSFSIHTSFGPAEETIGVNGTGTFNQSGGVHTVGDDLILGSNSGSVGVYNISNSASLTTPDLYVGYSGHGTFNQTGGTVNASFTLQLGENTGSFGLYTLGGGNLSTEIELVAGNGNGAFIQTGGTNTTILFVLAFASNTTGTYTLSGGQMNVSGPTYLGGGPTNSAGGLATLNINGGSFNSGTNTIIIANPATGTNVSKISMTAGTLTAGNVINSGSIIQQGGTATLAALSGTGSTSVGGGTGLAKLTLTSFNQASISIPFNGKLIVTPAASFPGTNLATSLTVFSGGSLDLGNSNLLTSTAESTIQSYLKAGYNGGAWNGSGAAIVSTSANLSSGSSTRSLGYASSTDSVAGSVVIPAGQTLVKYTTPGDADLSGNTDFNDFLALQNAYNKPGNWSQGDFDYTGTVDFNDFLILQNNYNHNLNANGTVAGGSAKSALAKASSLTASPSVPTATVTYVLSPNDDGHGNNAPGKFAVYAIDSTADGNHGMASFSVDVQGATLVTNFAPKGTYDDGTNTGNTVAEGFTLLRTGNGAFSTLTDPAKSSQDTVDASGVQLIYGMGQLAGNLNSQAPAGSSGGTGKVQPTYAAELLVMTGTFSGSSLAFNTDMTFDKANVFLTGSTADTEAAGITLTTAGVPEPTTLSLMALAAGGLLGRRKRRSC